MFDYTKAAFRQTLSDLKKVDYVRVILTQLVYLGYLVYTLIAKTGLFWVNVFLLALSFSYTVFYLITTKFGKNLDGNKEMKAGTKTAYVWIKRAVRIFTLGIAVYGVCYTAQDPSPWNVLFTALMIVGFVLQIVFEILIKILSARIAFITDGIEMDVDNILRPFRATGDFMKRITGQEVEPKKELTKNQLFLKEKVEEHKTNEKKKKVEKKRLFKEGKLKKKLEEHKKKKEEKKRKKQLAKEKKKEKSAPVATQPSPTKKARAEKKSTETKTAKAETKPTETKMVKAETKTAKKEK